MDSQSTRYAYMLMSFHFQYQLGLDNQDLMEAIYMKQSFVASLVKRGLLGGSIVADSEAITYHTGKLTIPPEYRHLVMKYEDISEVAKGWLLSVPL